MIALLDECRVCRCTDAQACDGGCSWVITNLCDRCEETWVDAVRRVNNALHVEPQKRPDALQALGIDALRIGSTLYIGALTLRDVPESLRRVHGRFALRLPSGRIIHTLDTLTQAVIDIERGRV